MDYRCLQRWPAMRANTAITTNPEIPVGIIYHVSLLHAEESAQNS